MFYDGTRIAYDMDHRRVQLEQREREVINLLDEMQE